MKFIFKLKSYLLASATIFVLGCAGTLPPINQDQKTQNPASLPTCDAGDSIDNEVCIGPGGDQYAFAELSHTQQPPVGENTKVDIAFVIDTSASLNNERGLVANGISNLVREFPNADYRIAVILAHPGRYQSQTNWSGVLYKKNASDPLIIDSRAPQFMDPQGNPDVEAIRVALENKMSSPPDPTGGFGESGIISLTRAVTENLAANRAAGFFREDAALATIFVSDENDRCTHGYPNQVLPNGELGEYQTYCFQNGQLAYSPALLYQALLGMQAGRPLMVAGILYTGNTGFFNPPFPIPSGSGYQDEIGYGYIELLQLADGVAVDLGNPSPTAIPDGLAYISDAMITSFYAPKTSFLLSHSNVDPESILVTVNDREVDFEYLASANVVRISALNAGQAGDVVKIRYRYRL